MLEVIDHNPIMITLVAKQHSEAVEMGGNRRWRTKRYVWHYYEQLMREEAETAYPIDDFQEVDLKKQLSVMQRIISYSGIGDIRCASWQAYPLVEQRAGC